MKSIYVIYDEVSHLTGDPITFENDSVACRALSLFTPGQEINPFFMTDLSLYRVAEFDSPLHVTALEVPIRVGRISDFCPRKDVDNAES